MQTTSPVTPLMHLPPGGYGWVSPQGSLPALLSGSSPNGRMTCPKQQGEGMNVRVPHSITHRTPRHLHVPHQGAPSNSTGPASVEMPAAGQGNARVTPRTLHRILGRIMFRCHIWRFLQADLLVDLHNTVIEDIWEVDHKVEDGRAALVATV